MSEALAKATKELVDAEESLLDSRTEESRQIRKLKKQTDQVKDSQKEFENSGYVEHFDRIVETAVQKYQQFEATLKTQGQNFSKRLEELEHNGF